MTPITRNIGILGAGQLGRMLAMAGYPLGQKFGFYGFSKDEPSAMLGHMFAHEDEVDALDKLIDWADIVTYESENTDLDVVRRIEAAGVPVYPGPDSLYYSQHRGREKRLFQALEIPTAPFEVVDSLDALRAAVKRIGTPSILKTTTEGYDGKGQFRLKSTDDVEAAWQAIGGGEAILEGFVDFRRELSMIAVRGQDGEMVFYPLVENYHHDGILRLTRAPAEGVSPETRQMAETHMRRLMIHLNHVGVLTLELFETDSGLVANEMAPRVHNSGHWTMEGAQTSQFENHIRAMTGLPLGSPRPVTPWCAMVNIIGKTGPIETALRLPGVHVHLYDKAERPGRKLGHLNVVADSAYALERRLQALAPFLPAEMAVMR